MWIEQLETEPSKYLPDVSDTQLSDTVVKVDINQPMKEILNTLTKVQAQTLAAADVVMRSRALCAAQLVCAGAGVCAARLNSGECDDGARGVQYPIKTRLSLTGTLVVARDIAHAKLKEVSLLSCCLVAFARAHVHDARWPRHVRSHGDMTGLGSTEKQRLDQGKGLPDYVKNHLIYYAGPAKTPEGMPSGSFGPTTGKPV